MAEGGTLYLEDVETLSLKSQYGLYQLIRYKTGSRDFARTMGFHIRVIASSILTPEDLGNLAFQEGSGRTCIISSRDWSFGCRPFGNGRRIWNRQSGTRSGKPATNIPVTMW